MNSKNDIVQIRKYLNGELDTRAMHELERRALDDPFLADALEGFEAAGDQKVNINELEERLQQRVDDKKVKRMIPWGPVSIAASILVVIGAGIWFFTTNQSSKEKQLAQVITPETQKPMDTTKAKTGIAQATPAQFQPAIKSPKPDQFAKANKQSQPAVSVAADEAAPAVAETSPTVAEPQPLANDVLKQAPKTYKDSVALNEVVVSNYKPVKKTDTSLFVRKAPNASSTQLLQSKVAGVEVKENQSRGNYGYMRSISGVVIGKDNGMPITGATVKIVGKGFGVVTDSNGKFKLPNVSDKQTLSIGYLGYNPKQVKISNKDSVKIALEPNTSSLSEVVVTRSVEKDEDASNKEAHPREGWSKLKDYLNKNAVSPDGKTGKVQLSFTVAADGILTDFNIIKSLDKIADQKAIDLVTYGTSWVGNSDGKPHQVKVTVKFH